MGKIEEAINQKQFKSEYQKAFINLIYTSNWLRDQTKGFFKQHKITQQQYNVLRILKGQHPKVCNPGYIKDVMLDKSPDLTRLIDRMVEKKLVNRKICDTNRRMVEIGITKKGLKLLDAIKPDNELQKLAKKNLTPKEAKQLSDILDKLRG